jgi:hypothetical protein
MKSTHCVALLAALAITGGASAAQAETVTTRTTVAQKEIPGTVKINFAALDLNNDGILSRSEVARKLFYIFDSDGNEVIDNREIKKNRVLTFIPLEKTELTMIDFDDDGKVDTSSVTNDQFMEFSMLHRFDKDLDGLSAQEFIGQSFLELDTDRSKVIEPQEWRDAYIASVSPLVAKQYRYNK